MIENVQKSCACAVTSGRDEARRGRGTERTQAEVKKSAACAGEFDTVVTTALADRCSSGFADKGMSESPGIPGLTDKRGVARSRHNNCQRIFSDSEGKGAEI